MENENIIWQDKKRPIFGLPLSFTKYSLTNDKLIIDSGLLVRRQSEVKLFRVMDFEVIQTLIQRIFGVGNIKCYSKDDSQGDFFIYDIKEPYKVKDLISSQVDIARKDHNVYTGEYLE